jgi:hypothetical protein
MITVGRNWTSGSGEEYRFGFNGQEQEDEVYGNGHLYTATFWEYDSRIGRRWNLDPKPNPSMSQYSCFENSPIIYTDALGDTTFRFNLSGEFIDVINLTENGLWGATGQLKTSTDGSSYFIGDRYFQFNDPRIDVYQLESLKPGEKAITTISDKEMNSIMIQTDIYWRWLGGRTYFAANESGRDGRGEGRMDYGLKLGGSPGGGGNEGHGNFILFESSSTAYNAMDAGNYLWGQAMKRLGFDYSTARTASQTNEKYKDSQADQRAIKSGFHHEVSTKHATHFELNQPE